MKKEIILSILTHFFAVIGFIAGLQLRFANLIFGTTVIEEASTQVLLVATLTIYYFLLIYAWRAGKYHPLLLLLLFVLPILGWLIGPWMVSQFMGVQGMPRRFYDYMPIPK